MNMQRSHGCLLTLIATGVLAGAGAAQRVDEQTEAVRATVEKWVETRKLISAERKQWTLGRELLQDRIALLQREIETLRGKIAESEQNITESARKKQELTEENEQLLAATATLRDVIGRLEQATRKLLQRVPDPLRERVKVLSQQMPEDPNDTKVQLGQRFMVVVGILNDVNKFNREITVTSEVRTLADGSTAEVTALYLGIGHGYYVTANGTAAGIGTAGADAWVWTPADDAAPEIAKAVAVFKSEQMAAFAKLPVRIQ